MPRKAAVPSMADEQAAPGGAAAVDRALSVLSAFRPGDRALSLAELADRTRLYKSTVLRLAASLAHGGLLHREDDGRWALGPEISRLAALRAGASSLEDVVLPLMRALMEKTRESVSFHVRRGDQRVCLLRVDSPQLLRDHIRAGDVLPLDRGAGGRVLMAFGGARGRVYEQIRSQGYVCLSGDRVPGLLGISAPVWRAGGELAGALTLTLPEQRMKARFVPELRATAAELTRQLAGNPPDPKASRRP